MSKKGSILEVKVRPNAGRTRIRKVESGLLTMDVAAPPEKGRANRELLDFLAKVLGISRSELDIVRGKSSRNKWVRVPLDSEELWARLKGSSR